MRHIFHKNLHKLYELIDRLWTFRLQIFIFLHIFHLLVQFVYQRYELLFIRLVILVKFYDPFLQNVKQRINAIIVRLLLKASGKARINRHYLFITTYNLLKIASNFYDISHSV